MLRIRDFTLKGYKLMNHKNTDFKQVDYDKVANEWTTTIQVSVYLCMWRNKLSKVAPFLLSIQRKGNKVDQNIRHEETAQ